MTPPWKTLLGEILDPRIHCKYPLVARCFVANKTFSLKFLIYLNQMYFYTIYEYVFAFGIFCDLIKHFSFPLVNYNGYVWSLINPTRLPIFLPFHLTFSELNIAGKKLYCKNCIERNWIYVNLAVCLDLFAKYANC